MFLEAQVSHIHSPGEMPDTFEKLITTNITQFITVTEVQWWSCTLV